MKKTHLVDKGAAEVGQGDALDEPGVEAEEVVDGVGVVPEAVLLGQDGEGGLQEGLEHVEEAGDAGAEPEPLTYVEGMSARKAPRLGHLCRDSPRSGYHAQ